MAFSKITIIKNLREFLIIYNLLLGLIIENPSIDFYNKRLSKKIKAKKLSYQENR